MESLLNDDVGDLDALMRQLSSQPDPPRPVFLPKDLAPPVTLEAPLGTARMGRRGTIQLVESPAPVVVVATVTEADEVPWASSPWMEDTHRVDSHRESKPTAAPPEAEDTLSLDWLGERPLRVRTEVSKSGDAPTVAVLAEVDETDAVAALKEEECKLLSEIAETMRLIEDEQNRLVTAELRAEAELVAMDATVLLKVEEVNHSAHQGIEKARQERQHYTVALPARLEELTTSALAEMATSLVSSVAQKFQRQEESLRDSIGMVSNTLTQLRNQVALLTEGSAKYTPQGIAVTLADSASISLDVLCDVGRSVVSGYISERLGAVRSKVVDFIRHESLDAAHAVWEAHRILFTKQSNERRSQLVSFLEERVSTYTSFMEQRRCKREDDCGAFRAAVSEMTAALRCRGEERWQQRRMEVSHAVGELAAAHAAELNRSAEFIAEKFKLIQKADDEVASQQERDCMSKIATHLSVTEKLHSAEVEGLSSLAKSLRVAVQHLPAAAEVVNVDVMVGKLHSAITDFRQCIETSAGASRTVLAAVTLDACSSLFRQEENQLRMLLREKESVVEELQREVAGQWCSLDASRQKCCELRCRVTQLFEDQAAVVHEQRLLQASASATVAMLSTSWEAEHRARLSETQEQQSEHLLHVGAQILLAAQSLQQKSAAQRRLAAVNASVSRAEDEQFNERMTKLQTMWSEVLSKWVAMGDKLQVLQMQQSLVGSEEAKLCFERMTHEAMRDEFTTKARSLQLLAAQVAAESAQVVQEKEAAEAMLKSVHDGQDALFREHNKLTLLQSDLMDKQHEVLTTQPKKMQSRQPQQDIKRVSPFADLLLLR